MEKCLEAGAEVNNRSKEGTPVFVAACEEAQGNEDVSLLMLTKGADPNSKDEVGS